MKRRTTGHLAALAARAYPIKAVVPAEATDDGKAVELRYEEPAAGMNRSERRAALKHARKALGLPS